MRVRVVGFGRPILPHLESDCTEGAEVIPGFHGRYRWAGGSGYVPMDERQRPYSSIMVDGLRWWVRPDIAEGYEELPADGRDLFKDELRARIAARWASGGGGG